MFNSASAKILPHHFLSSSFAELPNLPPRKLALQCSGPLTKAFKKQTLFTTSFLSKDALESVGQPSWDHTFNENASPISHNEGKHDNGARVQRQTMTAHEIRAFDEMFDMIFDSTPAAIKQNQVHTSPLDHSIDLGKENNSDLISRLRRYSRRMKKTTEIDEILDRKKQEIASCRSDQELLDWAMREVFAESQRYADEAKQSRNGQTLELQPPAYSHLVAFLMRVFRDQYRDPYLALSIFEHAKSLSAASYVFGCSTLAYNELLQTRWVCFRDLQGVHDILQEMRTNGVEVDAHTRSIVENLRRQIGEENLWVNDNEAGAEEVWRTITKIDQLISRREDNVPKRRRWRDWKEVSLNDLPDDKWEFGDWTLPR